MLMRAVFKTFGWLQSWRLQPGLTPLPGVAQLSDAVTRVLACNPSPMTLQGTNTYLIGTGRRRILVDTGSASVPEYVDRLERVLREADAELQEVVLTHWHPDHVGGLADIRRRLGDVPARKFPRPEAAETPGVTLLSDGDVISTEGATLRVVHTPGHCTDHVVLMMSEGGVLFSGDCVLGETTAVFEDLADYMASLQRLLEMAPRVIYPGHGPVVENPVEKIQHYIDHRLERERQLMTALRASDPDARTVAELVKTVYTDIPFYMRRPASVNVKHHLDKLVKDGAVAVSEGERYSLVKDGECSAGESG
ncbi:endoribonuclease LACTB2-like [Pollicipes pollicipes]|uniref:endoribonuclease LACTB2-like n=1 Tax=Pollicipes pollicipes TaxID=41117 RepID=UPI001884EE56|nr:endoribonuclease LACTB2-like [Pollicipes pollicipes]